ncbi:hypothetical protein CIPAW_10G136200 [Carya illinoinensis]|uniref:Uncharacterized protein n=1 Tax=Carya illinoinensis TaxID=32201 RepID=A0A8T1PFN7_CARIL|nr:hypothetical protein CIPAW_10G136200 [Carya illinoinensis]
MATMVQCQGGTGLAKTNQNKEIWRLGDVELAKSSHLVNSIEYNKVVALDVANPIESTKFGIVVVLDPTLVAILISGELRLQLINGWCGSHLPQCQIIIFFNLLFQPFIKVVASALSDHHNDV